MSILKHLDKKNLHHAYLIEGARDEIISEINKFCESINISTTGNPDFVHMVIDNLKIKEAFELRDMSSSKGFSDQKKIFTICTNTISLDAQNVLLKMFEEPIENTHFFLVVPDTNALLKTVVSRFYLIKPDGGTDSNDQKAEEFIAMPLQNRIDFIKELLIEPEDSDDGETIIVLDSARSKAIKFLNALELTLHNKILMSTPDTGVFEHFFKVREYLRMPGSSAKSLMESMAIIVPKK
jgi:DNA polymerase III delta prime subunit